MAKTTVKFQFKADDIPVVVILKRGDEKVLDDAITILSDLHYYETSIVLANIAKQIREAIRK